jgi:putative cell wall-binding protein
MAFTKVLHEGGALDRTVARACVAALLLVALVLGTAAFGVNEALGIEDEASGAPTLAVFQAPGDVWDGSVDVGWYNTNDTYFEISTAAQLAGLAAISTPRHGEVPDTLTGASNAVAGDGSPIARDNFAGKTIKLTADIYLNEDNFSGDPSTANKWNPISDFNVWDPGAGGGAGLPSGTFGGVAWQGVFDGNGKVVHNLYLDNRSINNNFGGYQGFFAGIGIDGIIKNVGVTGAIYGRLAGGIAACPSGVPNSTAFEDWPRIMNCFTNVALTGNGSSSRSSGGIIGGEDSGRICVSVINCYARGSVQNSQAGGVAGAISGLVAGCYNTSSITGGYTGSIVSTLVLQSASDDNNRAFGQLIQSFGLAMTDPNGNLYRYRDNTTKYNGNPIRVTTGFRDAEALKASASDLGDGYVADTAAINDGYPILFWQAGLSELSLAGATAALDTRSFPYTGAPIEPAVGEVKLGDKVLTEGLEYLVSYENNVLPGSDTARAVIIGIGRYAGSSTSAAFSITGDSPWVRLAGDDRYDTMKDIIIGAGAGTFTADNTDTVIVADGTNFPDALAASGLAGVTGAPVVLTTPDALSAQAEEVIQALQPSTIYIAGGKGSVSEAVEASLKALVGDPTAVIRSAGPDRAATALDIYAKGKVAGAWGTTAVIADGMNYPDALSISPISFLAKAPIFLSTPDEGLTANAVTALKAAIADGSITRVLIVGGIGSVPDSVKTQLGYATTDTALFTRLGGATRYETSVLIAQYATQNLPGVNYQHIAVATGSNYPDALAGGAFAGKKGTVLLLVDDEGGMAGVQDIVGTYHDRISVGHIFGGIGSVSETMKNALEAAAKG